MIYDANVQVVDGDEALNKILISDKLTRINCNGRVAEKYLKKYSHLSDGGWFLPVLNPLADFLEDDWGCLKPVNPRICQDGIKLKTIKYEHPPEMAVQPFFLKVTARVWERIAQRHDVAMPDLLPQNSYGKEFWEWVRANLQVYNAASRLANKITYQVNKKAVVKIAQWHPELGKGVDDILVQNGIETVETILNSALPFQVSKFRKSINLSYPVLNYNRRHLDKMPKLSAKIVAIKSPKNTGKTWSLSQMVNHAIKAGKKVIVLGHYN